MTQPPSPPSDDAWPTSEQATAVASRETLVGATAPQPEPAGPPPDRRIGAGMLLGLAALALVAIGIAIAYLLAHRGDDKKTTTVVVTTAPTGAPAASKVTVPRVVGLKEQEALVRLGQLGLRPKEVFRPTSKPNRLVVDQKPKEAIQVAKGSQVTLVIDSGAPQIAVPDLSGQSFAAAQAKLDAAGLDSARTTVTSDQPAGTVVDQAPKPGAKAAKGSVVTLSVSKQQATPSGTTTAPGATTSTGTTTSSAPAPPPSNATMPDVGGQTEQAAVTAMNRAGVLASLVFVPSQDPLGTVEQQAKPAGTTVQYRAHVQINVSKGPGAKPDVSVPNTIGQTLTQSVATMNGANLRLIYVKLPVTSKTQVGKIVQQSPLAGGKAPQNAQVLVYLGAATTG